jgi:hypothetical protein
MFKHWMEEEHGDEDIGQGSLEALLATIMEGNSTDNTIDEQQLMKEFEKLLDQIQTPPQ